MRLIVVGAGAAGCMLALRCAREAQGHEVILLEREETILPRCLRTSADFPLLTNAAAYKEEARESYPVGGLEMLGLLHRWDVNDTLSWFESEGLSVEEIEDGAWITPLEVDAFRSFWADALAAAGVQVLTGRGMLEFAQVTDGFRIWTKGGDPLDADLVCLATGITQGGFGLGVAGQFGHEISEPKATLLDLHCSDSRLRHLQGLRFPEVTVGIPECNLSVTGSMEITGKGLGGDAIGKLTSLATDWIYEHDFNFNLNIRWLDSESKPEPAIRRAHQEFSRRTVDEYNPISVPQRFWESLLRHLNIREGEPWGRLDNRVRNSLTGQLLYSNYRIEGHSMWKPEWTCRGGVSLKEFDTPSLESRHAPGLYCIGEMLDIDGLPSGFTSQQAYTTAANAASAIISRLS